MYVRAGEDYFSGSDGSCDFCSLPNTLQRKWEEGGELEWCDLEAG